MKKTSKPAPKKTAAKKQTAKKPAAKKTSAKPKSKAAGQGDLAQLIERLTVIAERLGEAVDRLEQSALAAPATQLLPPTSETHHDEHADDLEVPSNRCE